MNSLLIKNGLIVTAEQTFIGDILTTGKKIATVGQNLSTPDSRTKVIDASGLLVMPGGIDPHVHFELPVGNNVVSSDDFYTGTRAALAGGTTTVIDFVTPEPGQSLIDALTQRKKQAKKSACDYGLHISVTHWRDSIEEELRTCAEMGTSSVKIYLAYKETIGLEDRDIINVMAAAARLNMPVLAHCEHGDLISWMRNRLIAEGKTAPKFHALSRPTSFEAEAINRALLMAETTGCPLYIVHISTKQGVAALRAARERGVSASGETCPHYLLLDEESYNLPAQEAVKVVMSPPLRPQSHQQPLWDALEDGALSCVATDHCPFTLQQKLAGIDDFSKIPNGVAGVEHRLSLLYTFGVKAGKMSPQRFVDVVSTGPAKLFGLYPRKGALQPGSDADIVLWDPNADETISAQSMRQNCDYTIYEGLRITGKPATVISGGAIRLDHGELFAEPGEGEFLFRGR